MKLWMYWWEAVLLLRPGCSRLRTFMWFATCIAGFTVRNDFLGVSSLVRALGLQGAYYDNLLDSFHSTGIKLDEMNRIWFKVVLKLFPSLLRVNDRLVLVGDGIKIAKQGKKMPAVKRLHQESESNSKAQYIMGHSFQCVSILAQAQESVLAIPLISRIHEGILTSNRDRRTLLDKMISLFDILDITLPCYFVADAYYANRKVVKGVLERGQHLVTRAKSNAVAYKPYTRRGPKKPGRPKLFGKKVSIKRLFKGSQAFEAIESPVYGDKNIQLRYQVRDLIWRPAGVIVRFVLVIHPTRGQCILMSTDTSLPASEIIRLYGLRFKIEHSFKQAIHVIGTFSYHFWMKAMKPLTRKSGNQHLHRTSECYRKAVHRKMHAYHVFVLAGTISQGLLQYLATVYPKQVWATFGSWLRTIRPGLPPSERVVATALKQCLPEFLLANAENNNLAKFILERQDFDRRDLFRLAS